MYATRNDKRSILTIIFTKMRDNFRSCCKSCSKERQSDDIRTEIVTHRSQHIQRGSHVSTGFHQHTRHISYTDGSTLGSQPCGKSHDILRCPFGVFGEHIFSIPYQGCLPRYDKQDTLHYLENTLFRSSTHSSLLFPRRA